MMKENKTQEETLRVVKESIHDSMYESSKTLVKQLDKIGDKLTNVVEDFQRNNKQEVVEIEIGIDPTVEIETIQETGTGIEAGIEEIIETGIGIEVEIGEIVETTQEIEIEVEVEIDQTLEKEEEINQDQDQVKDTLTGMIFAITVTEQVMLHTGVLDLKII